MDNSPFVKPSLTVLTAQQIEQVHTYSLNILSRVGIRVDSSEALALFTHSGGAEINGDRVKISPELVEWALKSAPSSIDLFDRQGRPAFSAGDGKAHFGVGVTNLFYQDPQTDRLSGFTRQHMASGTRLAHGLPAYEIVSTLGIIKDAAPGTDDLYAVLEMAANTTKPLVILNSDPKQFAASLDLLESLGENFSARPWIIPYFNPVTPLIINRETGDKMIATIRRGIPFIFSNYGMAGTSTPISAAGTLTLLNAELLAGLVLSQMVKTGAPVILGSLPAFFDMKNMTDFYDPQTILLNSAEAEMMDFYHLPHAGTSGSGLGWSADLPAAGMHWLNHLTATLGKTGLVPFVGSSLGSKAFSPTSVVYANDVILQARHFATGFALNDETVNLNEMETAGPGGNFLMSKSTRQNFRSAYYTSSLFPRMSLEKWEQKDHPQAMDIIRHETTRLLNESQAPQDHDAIIEKGEALIRRLNQTDRPSAV